MRPTLHAAIAAVLLALSAPAAAHASLDVSRVGSSVTVTGPTSGEPSISVDFDGGVFVAIEGESVTSSDHTCTIDSGVAECGGTVLTHLDVALTGTGSDYVSLRPDAFSATATVSADTGPGDDYLDSEGPMAITADLGTGNDDVTTGSGHDYVHGGAGSDNFDLGPGDDQGFGDADNDLWGSGFDADGADQFDGGTDVQATAGALTGDGVTYGNRENPVIITLPPDSTEVPTGNNGEIGEQDRFSRVENARASGDGRSVITGNERPNQLVGLDGDDTLVGAAGNDLLDGGLGADTLDGGADQDTIRARHSSEVDPDVDKGIACSGGTDDILVRDQGDPAGTNCEHEAPGFTADPVINGTIAVGALILVDKGQLFGSKATVGTEWYSCSTFGEDCRKIAETDNLRIEEAEVGRAILARITLTWAYGTADRRVTNLTGAVRPGQPAPENKGGQDGGYTPPGRTPGAPLTFAQTAAQEAGRKLGAGASLSSAISLGKGTATFEAAAVKSNALVLRGAVVPAVAGVACEKACTVSVTGTLVVVPKTKRRGKARSRSFKLRPQVLATAAGTMSVVRANVTSAQRRVVKKSKKAKLSFAFSVKYADGTTRTAKRSYLLKVK